MRAVILAAGAGRRLRPALGRWPKCLAKVGDSFLIERQIRALRECGVDEVTLVLGYRRKHVERVCGRYVDVVYNKHYASTNSLYSLWLARHQLANGFIVLNSDVLFHPQLLRNLIKSPHGNALLLAVRQAGVRYSDEEMKVHARDGQVLAIDKGLDDAKADGENVGIAKFSASGAARLLDILDGLVDSGALTAWLPRAFHAFCQQDPLYVVETGGYPWIEIDFPDDYARARREVLPAIMASEVPPACRMQADSDVSATFERMLHRV
jgi:L-glutamine-phosphate cytidylyltransferase